MRRKGKMLKMSVDIWRAVLSWTFVVLAFGCSGKTAPSGGDTDRIGLINNVSGKEASPVDGYEDGEGGALPIPREHTALIYEVGLYPIHKPTEKGSWAPSAVEKHAMDRRVMQCLAENSREYGVSRIMERLSDYWYQYAGVYQRGKKWMVYNFIYVPPQNIDRKQELQMEGFWKKHWVLVDGGGSTYWHVYIEVETLECILRVNGPK